jgi:hypothetical protein
LLPQDPHRFSVIFSFYGTGFHWLCPKGFVLNAGGLYFPVNPTFFTAPLILNVKDHGAIVTAEWVTWGTPGQFIFALATTLAKE